MTDTSNWDGAGTAAALLSAVTEYGPRSLSNPQVLAGLLKDRLPVRSREASLVVSAAEVDVAAKLTSYLEQSLDVDTAVRLTAGVLSSERSIDPQACMWVTAEFARALGHSVSQEIAPPVLGLDAGGFQPPPPLGAPVGQPPPPFAAPIGQPQWQPMPQIDQAPLPGTETAPLGNQQAAPAAAVPFGRAAQPTPALPTRGGSRGWLFGVLGVIVAIGIYIGVAAAAKLPPLQASPTTTTATTTTTAITTTTVPPTSTTVPATTVAPTTSTPPAPSLRLTALLPDQQSTDPAGNIDVAKCETISPYPAGLKGVVSALACLTVPGYAGWTLFGYKLANAADYAASIAAYNNDKGFDSSAAGNTCPGSGTGQGLTDWSSNTYAQRNGQQLECLFTASSSSASKQPTYIWTAPSQFAIFEMVAAPSASASQLDKWWAQDGEPGSA